MVRIRVMTINDYNKLYDMWIITPGMGLNTTDDSRAGIARWLVEHAMSALEQEGIHKVALVAFEKNEPGNAFWEKMGFGERPDLVYRNKNIHMLERIDT